MANRMTIVATTLLGLASSATNAASATPPWGNADLNQGKTLHNEKCIDCHTRMYGGDGSKMYTRDGRLLSNQLELLQRVTSCNAVMNSSWFPDEEGHVAAWLNSVYYRFAE